MKTRKVIILLFIASMLLGCAAFPSSILPPNEVRDAFLDVLLGGELRFRGCNYRSPTGEFAEYIKLSEIFAAAEEPYYKHAIRRFAIVDMNGDGQPEVVLEIGAYYDKIILFYEEEIVYGFEYMKRSMMLLKTDGTFCLAGGVDNYYGRLHFSKGEIELEFTGYYQFSPENPRFFIGVDRVSEIEYKKFDDSQMQKEDIEWHPYINETITEHFPLVWSIYGGTGKT